MLVDGEAVFVAVGGSIGVGKSTLLDVLRTELRWQVLPERTRDRRYLVRFGQDPRRWAFHNAVDFFVGKCEQQLKGLTSPLATVVCQDRCALECYHVFARHYRLQEYISEEDLECLTGLLEVMGSRLRMPDLLLYLYARPEVLLRRIERRGREYERGVTKKHLEQLNEIYREWLSGITCPVVRVDSSAGEWSHRDVWGGLVEQIGQALPGSV